MRAALPYLPPVSAARPERAWRRLLDDRRFVRAKVLAIALLLVAGIVLEQLL